MKLSSTCKGLLLELDKIGIMDKWDARRTVTANRFDLIKLDAGNNLMLTAKGKKAVDKLKAEIMKI